MAPSLEYLTPELVGTPSREYLSGVTASGPNAYDDILVFPGQVGGALYYILYILYMYNMYILYDLYTIYTYVNTIYYMIYKYYTHDIYMAYTIYMICISRLAFGACLVFFVSLVVEGMSGTLESGLRPPF